MSDAFPYLTKTTFPNNGTNNFVLDIANLSSYHWTPKQQTTKGVPALANGQVIVYAAVSSADTGGGAYEIGEGVYTDATNTVARTASLVHEGSSGPGVLTDFGLSGTSDFYVLGTPASRTPRIDRANEFTQNQKISTAANPTLTLAIGGSTTNKFDITNNSSGVSSLKHTSAPAIAADIRVDPAPSDNTSLAQISLFRITSTVGSRFLRIYKGDASATINFQVSADAGDLDMEGALDVAKGAILNSGGADNDTQIKGLIDDNLGYFDAGNDRVGIGTSTPARKLHIVATNDPIYARIESTTANGRAGLECKNDAQIWQLRVSADDSFQIIDATATKFPVTVQPLAPDNTIYVAASGAVGIGTASPARKLDVNGSIGGLLGVFTGSLTVNEDGATDGDFRVEGDTDANLLFTDASADKVGIGESAPQTKLHIDGGATSDLLLGPTLPQGLLLEWKSSDEVCSVKAKSQTGVDAKLRLEAIPQNGTSAAYLEIFRSTSTTGTRALLLYAGDGTSASYFGVNAATGHTIISGSGGLAVAGGGSVQIGSLNIKGKTSAAADPSTTQLPNDGDCSVHKNTTSGNVFFAYNDGGAIKKVQLV